MMRKPYFLILPILFCFDFNWYGNVSDQKTQELESHILIDNGQGRMLGYSALSGIQILEEDNLRFKDLNKNNQLDPYEDWRIKPEERAKDLASKMSIEQIAGLMLYSGHQRIPGGGFGRGGTYNGKSYEESGAEPSDLTDDQIDFLTNDNLRHVLITSVENAEVAAQWNNNAQSLVEGIGLGIPINTSSDPRHEAASDEEYTLGAGGDISRWPPAIGLAASLGPTLVEEFGRIASVEYRALGISTALSPQVDLATDPRWYRFFGTFGPDPQLSIEMARAYVDGFQTSSGLKEISNGWGYESVNAMVKHWPGGGTGEGGRDAHYGFGKYAVFPGQNLETHMRPFLEGAFDLKGGTQMAAAVMPYYTISTDQDPGGENVGNAFSKYFITTLLREKYGYNGVVCTDWGVTREDAGMARFGRTPWGVEHLNEVDKHYKVIMAGCDQFGGNNDAEPVLGAYEKGVESLGELFMRERFEQSARRLLLNLFRTGLFENPYLNVEETGSLVGNPEFMSKGYEAQLKSIVLLKNEDGVLPLKKDTKIYVPKRYVPESSNFFGNVIPARWEEPIQHDLLKRYAVLAEDPTEADVALVVIEGPQNGRTAGYSEGDIEDGGNGFLPISLQYDSYTASAARSESLAGDSREGDVLNRSYYGKTVTAKNKSDLEMIMKVREEMNDKPVIVILKMSNPTVVAEFEQSVDGLLINFGVQDQAILDVVSGQYEPTGLLPLQMPANMETVETQYEDKSHDMIPYQDEAGNLYDFGFGMNWKGPISDNRTERFIHAEN